jgi:hypothetical protein
MNGKQVAGIICMGAAVLPGVTAVISLSQGPSVADPSGLGVSRAVGAFLPAVAALILGAWLLQKPKPK